MPDNSQSENQHAADIRGEVTPHREKQIENVKEVFPTTGTSDKIGI